MNKDSEVYAGPEQERREFLKRCGRFALVTPPAITMMLAVSSTPAHATVSGFPNGGYTKKEAKSYEKSYSKSNGKSKVKVKVKAKSKSKSKA